MKNSTIKLIYNAITICLIFGFLIKFKEQNNIANILFILGITATLVLIVVAIIDPYKRKIWFKSLHSKLFFIGSCIFFLTFFYLNPLNSLYCLLGALILFYLSLDPFVDTSDKIQNIDREDILDTKNFR